MHKNFINFHPSAHFPSEAADLTCFACVRRNRALSPLSFALHLHMLSRDFSSIKGRDSWAFVMQNNLLIVTERCAVADNEQSKHTARTLMGFKFWIKGYILLSLSLSPQTSNLSRHPNRHRQSSSPHRIEMSRWPASMPLQSNNLPTSYWKLTKTAIKFTKNSFHRISTVSVPLPDPFPARWLAHWKWSFCDDAASRRKQ